MYTSIFGNRLIKENLFRKSATMIAKSLSDTGDVKSSLKQIDDYVRKEDEVLTPSAKERLMRAKELIKSSK